MDRIVERQMACRIAAMVVKVAHRPILAPQGLDKNAVRSGMGTMLYFIDAGRNHSKFYEMLVTEESGGTWLLMKRWGALTDSTASGRVSSKDERYRTLGEAQAVMEAHARSKIAKGYVDAFGPHHLSPVDGLRLKPGEYPIGLDRQVGFGWGTQSITKCLPALRALRKAIGEAMGNLERLSGQEARNALLGDLEQARTDVELLAREDSAMAAKLRGYLIRARQIVGQVARFDVQDVRGTLGTIARYVDKQMSFCKTGSAKVATRRYSENATADAAEIAGDVIKSRRSRGWAGDIDALQKVEMILGQYNIGYVDDVHGDWAYVQGGSRWDWHD